MPDHEPDLDARDPNELNSHVKVEFEEVFGEPDGAHSHPCVWRCAFKCFNLGKNLAYLILTFVYAIPIAWWWGCEFASVTFFHVWYLTPFFRMLDINCASMTRLLRMCTMGCIGPCCEACGMFFSNIKVTNASG